MKDKTKGFTCESCNKWNEYPLWVHAHWRDLLTFTCECGAQYSVVCGLATLEKKPKLRRGRTRL